MSFILDLLGLERSGEVSRRLKVVEKQLKILMADTNEVVTTITELTESLALATSKLNTVASLAGKVGTETDRLLVTIKDLQDAINNQTEVPAAIVTALAAATTQAQAVSGAVAAVETAVTTVDQKVED